MDKKKCKHEKTEIQMKKAKVLHVCQKCGAVLSEVKHVIEKIDRPAVVEKGHSLGE